MFTDAESARGAFLLAERDMFTTPRALAIRRAMKVESQDKACKAEAKRPKQESFCAFSDQRHRAEKLVSVFITCTS